MDTACHPVGGRATLGREEPERTESATICGQIKGQYSRIGSLSQETMLELAYYSSRDRNGVAGCLHIIIAMDESHAC